MTTINPIWAEGQRKKWLRHDWRNWVKPQAHHLYEGLEEKRALRFDEVARQRKAEAAAIAAGRREQEAIEQEVRQLRWMVKDLQIELALRRLEEKYDPNQPREPAGSSVGGRWTSAGGPSRSGQATIDREREGASGQPTSDRAEAADIDGAGKADIVKKFGAWTARQFVSKYCQGTINRELPGEFENVTIADIWKLAKGGDARARTCLKLLNSGRFRK